MRIRALLRNLFSRTRVERDLDDEIRGYCAMLEAEKVARGVPRSEARRQAALETGGIEQVKEEVRTVRAGAWVEQLLQDTRHGARMLWRHPVFTIVAVLTLSLGVGATAAIFTVVNAVLWRPLPFAAVSELFAVEGLSYTGEFVEFGRQARTFDVASYERHLVTVTGQGEPLRIPAASVSPNFMSLLGATPYLGRSLQDGDERARDGAVAIVSQAFWLERLGGESTAIGRTLTIDGRAHTIVGVMPAGFGFPALETQVWRVASIDTSDRVRLWSTTLGMIGRVRPGFSIDAANAEIRALVPSMRTLFPWRMPATYGSQAAAVPLHEALVDDARPMLLLLLSAVAIVLVICAVNVSNLLVARTLARGRELAIRASLGAARGRILRQVFTEGTLLVVLGVLGAAPVAYAGVGLLTAWMPTDVPRPVAFAIDVPLLVFALLATAISALVVGLVPAIRASRVDLAPQMADSGRNSQGRRTRWTSNLLVAAQMALAVALVVTATLLVRSLQNLRAVSPGFTAVQLVSARISPPSFRYAQPASRQTLYADVLERAAAIPGVTDAALTDRLPFAGEAYSSVFMIEGRPDPARTGEWPLADVSGIVSPGYFPTLGIPVLEGRTFTSADTADALRVAVISESLARAYWPGERPIGRRISFPGGAARPLTIVGIVGDTKWESATEEKKSALYVALAQSAPSAMKLVVRTHGEADATRAHIRAVVRSLDNDTPVDQERTMEQLMAASVQAPSFAASLVGGFAAVGLLLGAIGIYGTVSDQVNARRREIGVRMALGAQRLDVFRAVLSGTFVLACTGAVVGLFGALLLTRLLESMLFGVRPTDPAAYAVAAGLLIVTAVAAAWMPARRASATDPLIVLKAD